MRALYVTLPAGLFLAVAGGVLYFASRNPKPPVSPPTSIVYSGPIHPITPQMEKDSAKKTLKDALVFETVDWLGEPRTVGRAEKPQLLLFVLDGCPCSIDAQPIYNDLSRHFKDRVEFLAIYNEDSKAAKKWDNMTSTAFPIIPDTDKKIIRAYAAKNSVYSALVSEGKIVRLWPGYSVEILDEINRTIAKELNEPVRPFDAKYAPVEKTSGCEF